MSKNYLEIDEATLLDTNLTEVHGVISIIETRQNDKNSNVWYRGSVDFTTCNTQNQEFKHYVYKRGLVNFTYTSAAPLPHEATLIGNVNRYQFENGAYALSLDVKLLLAQPLTYDNISDLLSETADRYEVQNELNRKLQSYKDSGLSATKAFLELSRATVSDRLKYVLQDVLGRDNDLMESLVISQLQPYVGKRNNFAKSMYQVYGTKAYNAMLGNPWEMILTVPNMGLSVCDKIADKLKIPKNDPRRLSTLLVKAIEQHITDIGSTYLPHEYVETLYNTHFSELYSYEDFEQALESEHITQIEHGYQPTNLYEAEQTIFKTSEVLASQHDNLDKTDIIESLNSMQTFAYTEKQREAIETSLDEHLFLLTGGPGVGKTTVLSGILKAHIVSYHLRPNQIICMSPTGKAAQRMMEQTGFPACTIHSRLQITPGALVNDMEPTVEALKKDNVKLMVVDEASMIDTVVAGCVFEVAQKLNCKLFIIGDVDQLPSIGPGQVFDDLLTAYPHIRLTEVKRQTDDSNIIPLANMVLNGEFPDLTWFKDKPDVFFVPEVNDRLPYTLTEKILRPKQDELADFQILTPYYNRNLNAEQMGLIAQDIVPRLNDAVQDVFNPTSSTVMLSINNNVVREGDRVVCKKNRNRHVVNGSIGYVETINMNGEASEWTITVNFDGYTEVFGLLEFEELELAYTLTIHKSQGSEYGTVIIPIVRNVTEQNNFLTRNILYTALTRAKSRVVFVGNIQSFKAVAKKVRTKRKTGLSDLFSQRDS